jgi:3-deoxy-D-manno-octulosonate 8-phosphate phosphatase KdsC-like HAD superfamily phosphatase
MTSSNQLIVNKIILDFDGIFAADMIYTDAGKTAKSFPWGIRHSIDILTEHGFDVYVITGDSTGMGQAITARFIKNLKIKDIIYCHSKDKIKYLKKNFDLSTCVYAGEDIYDLEIYKECFSVVPADTHNILASNATFVSKYKTRDYFFMDLAFNVLHHFKYNEMEPALMVKCITKDSTHESMSDYLFNLKYRNIFFLQQYSMRNHSDNTYNPLLDGNLNLTLHRIYNPLKFNPNLTVTITIPTNCNKDQKEMLIDFCNKTYGEGRIIFEEFEYGINAEENRTALKSYQMPYPSIYDVIISDFSGVQSLVHHVNVIYNFNISKNATLNRPYVDNHFHDQYKDIIRNVDFGVYGLTYILNYSQKEYMVSQGNELVINSGVIVDSKIINTSLLSTQNEYYQNLLDEKTTDSIRTRIASILVDNDLVLFMPFRLSDECYNWKGLIGYLQDRPEKIAIIVTNPNDADYAYPKNIDVINISQEFSQVNKKSLYFFLLHLINNTKIHIPIFEDPSVVLHQAILEMYTLTNKCTFLDKNDFNYETLSKASNKNETNKYDKYLRSLYYEEPRRLY